MDSFLKIAWRFLTSVKVGVTLLIILAVGAIAGTFIESTWDTPTAQRIVYHSLWYSAVMALMILNILGITLVSLNTFITIRHLRRPLKNPRAVAKLPETREIDVEFNAEKLHAVLKKHVGRVNIADSSMAAQSGLYQRWGSIITHIGMIFLLLGGVMLSVTAHFRGGPGGSMLWVGEGLTRDWYTVPDPSVPGGEAQARLDGFTIRLHDFDADYFPDTGVPRAFTSIVEIIPDDGSPASLHRINMGEALRYHGWKFSQNSFTIIDPSSRSFSQQMARSLWMSDGDGFLSLLRNQRMAIRLMDNRVNQPSPVFDAGVGNYVPVPNSDLFFHTPDGRSFELLRGDMVIASGPIEGTEVAAGDIAPGGADVSEPPPPSTGSHSAALVGTLPGAYTGLGVMRESEVIKGYFYVCFLLFISGIILAFTTAHCQVFACPTADGRGIVIGGRVRGVRSRLTRLIDRLEQDLRA